MSDRVLLTGVSGFVGGHLAVQLLQAGYMVRGSVRSLDKADKVRDTLARAGADVSRLEFVALDLLKDEGWVAAMAGCRYLQHTASPFVLRVPKDPQELIRPAVEGTRRAIEAALAAQVERVVLTSSIAAIQYGHSSHDRPLTEADWTKTDNARVGAYARSKTLAEQEAWRLMEAAGRRNDLAVINPAGIFGPLLDEDPGTSATIIQRMLKGNMPALPRIHTSIVDVRDVALLHVDAMTNPAAGGQRCIAAVDTLSLKEIANLLRPAFPQRRIPRHEIPDWIVRLAGRFNAEIRDNLSELGAIKHLDGTRAPARLNRPLIPAEESAIATGKSLEQFNLV